MLCRLLWLVWVLTLCGRSFSLAAEPAAPFDLKLDVLRRGYDGKTCMTQARVGIVPREGQPPILVATMTAPTWETTTRKPIG